MYEHTFIYLFLQRLEVSNGFRTNAFKYNFLYAKFNSLKICFRTNLLHFKIDL